MKKIIILSVLMMLMTNGFAMSKKEASQVLLSVVTEGNTEGVYQMLSQGANINIQDSNGKTPLLKAIEAGQIEIVSILLSKGAGVNYADKDGSTALIVACENNYPLIAEMITKRHVDFQHKNKKGYSALMISSLHGRKDIVKQLVSAGATAGSIKDSAGNDIKIVKEKKKSVAPLNQQLYAGL